MPSPNACSSEEIDINSYLCILCRDADFVTKEGERVFWHKEALHLNLSLKILEIQKYESLPFSSKNGCLKIRIKSN